MRQAKELEKTEKKLYQLIDDEKQMFADLWLNTDFEKELNLGKKPTEQDKKSWIRNNLEYRELKTKIAVLKAKQKYQERMFDISFNDKYNNKHLYGRL